MIAEADYLTSTVWASLPVAKNVPAVALYIAF